MRQSKKKIVSVEELCKALRDFPERSVGLCHGVFDLVHPGHLSHFKEASEQVDLLVVSLTSDKYVLQNKGAGHPRFDAQHRADIVAALFFVDYVLIDDNPNPCSLLRRLQPDIYFKGPDYKDPGPRHFLLQELEGAVLAEYGGELRFTESKTVYSSTDLLFGKRDFGKYHKDALAYAALAEQEYAAHPPVVLPSEFSRGLNDNMVMLLIRIARYKFAAKMLSAEDSILEIGSGYGLGCIFMGQYCRDVLGIDVQFHAVQEARSFNQRDNVRFEHSDFFDFPEDRKFDVVLAMDVIEHMDVAQGTLFVEKMARHLKPNGMIVVGTPSKYSWPYQSPFSQLSHVHCYDKEELQAIVAKSFGRVLSFSMNDEIVHTGHPKMAWYYYFLAQYPQEKIHA